MAGRVFFDFDDLFDAEEYLYFMEDTLREEDTPAQVTWLERALGVSGPCRVLDLGCGHGRHANELARRGHRVLGVDLVEGFLEVARAEAEREGLGAEFVRADIGAFTVDAPFDHGVCLFDAFGFFDDAHQEATLRRAHEALSPGGRLVLDLRTREWMVRIPPFSVVDKGNGDMMIDRTHFDVETGRLVDRRTYVRGGKRRDVSFSVRLYAYTEIKTLLEACGFRVVSAFGGWDGAPLSIQRPRTLVVASREQTPRPSPPLP